MSYFFLSVSLVAAGEKSQSHSTTSFPSELRVKLAHTPVNLPQEKKSQLQDAFLEACVGKVYKNKTVSNVQLDEFKAQYWGSNLHFTGSIIFEDGSIHEGFESHLYSDGFGGYEGFVRTRDGSQLIIDDIEIQ